jgi:lupus La protein
MFEEIEGPENRPVSIKHLTTFKRMRRFQPYSAVVAALRESPSLVVVDDGKFAGAGNEGVRRKEPLVVPDYEKDKRYKPDIIELFHRFKKQTRSFLDCSIYAKGFGDEKDAGQIKLEEFFKPYGAIATRKRRDEDEKWKGSVFVEFDTEDEAKQFLALDPMPKYNDNELLAMSKKDYVAMKCKEKGITPSWETDKNFEDRRGQHRGGRGGGRGRGGRGRGGDRGRGRGRGNSDRRGGGRDRSPRERRDRSGSPDSRDWNGRRDKFQNSKDFKGGRRGEKPAALPKDPNNPYGFELDERGIPVVQTTTKASQIDISSNDNKRKADKGDEEVIPKKAKIEIKEDA